LPGLEESIAVADAFLGAPDATGMMPWVRGGEKMQPFVERMLPTCMPEKGAKERLRQMPPVVEDRMAYQCFGVIEDSGIGRLVAVVPTKDGPRVDFKAYAEWSDVPFADLFAGKVKQAGELRLMLHFSNYYNYEFTEQAAYVAFDASASYEGTTSVTLYVRRGSDLEQRLSWAIGRLGLYPATVAVEAVKGSEKHRQYLITKLLALGYVVPGEPGE